MAELFKKKHNKCVFTQVISAVKFEHFKYFFTWVCMGTDSSGHCQAAALMDRFQQLIVNKLKSFRASAGSEALMRRHHRESGFEYVS